MRRELFLVGGKPVGGALIGDISAAGTLRALINAGREITPADAALLRPRSRSVIPFPDQTGRRAGPDSFINEVKRMIIHEEICVGLRPLPTLLSHRRDPLRRAQERRSTRTSATNAAPACVPRTAPSTPSRNPPMSMNIPRALRKYFSDPSRDARGHRHPGPGNRGIEDERCYPACRSRRGRRRHRDRPAHARHVASGRPEDHPGDRPGRRPQDRAAQPDPLHDRRRGDGGSEAGDARRTGALGDHRDSR